MGLFDDLFKKKGIPEKINFLGKDYEINPDAMVYSQQGLEKHQAKDYPGAVIAFTKAINAQPVNQNFYTMRGTAYEDSKNDLEAEKDFRKALELEPTNFLASYRLGMVYFRKKDFETAIKWLKNSYNNHPALDHGGVNLGNNNINFVAKKLVAANLGNFLTQVKKFDEGFKYLDEAIKLDPNYHNPYYVKGMALAQVGKPAEGIPYVKKAMQLGNPNAEMGLKRLHQLSQQANVEDDENEGNELDLNFVFQSSDHLRYENDRHVSGPHGGAPRAVKVEANINGGEGYTVTMFNTDGGKAVVQMAPKQMKLVNADNEKIELKGYGRDSMGASFADYGLTIVHDEGSIEKVILHMFDRNVDIQYLP